MTRNSAVATGRQVLAAVRRDQLSFLAAAIAYYAFVSVVPLLLVGLAVATTVGGEALAGSFAGAARGVLSPEAADVLESALASSAGRGEATIIGFAALAWSGLRVFRGLDIAFGRIYGGRGPKSLLVSLTDASVAFLALSLGVLATVVLAGLVPLSDLPWSAALGTVALAVVLTVLFVPLYYVFPDADLSPGEVLPGAALAGVGWTVLGTAFGTYASLAGSFQLYGVIGGVLL